LILALYYDLCTVSNVLVATIFLCSIYVLFMFLGLKRSLNMSILKTLNKLCRYEYWQNCTKVWKYKAYKARCQCCRAQTIFCSNL